jgi:uncharacterized protein YgfB (UPF0149 family)
MAQSLTDLNLTSLAEESTALRESVITRGQHGIVSGMLLGSLDESWQLLPIYRGYD